MGTATIITIVKYAALFAAFSALSLKLLFLFRYKARTNKPISYKWIGWYQSDQMMGTSSESRREFMQYNNKLSTVMWICIGLLILVYFLPE